MATPGKAVSMVLLPKFLGILPFDQAHKGAEEAAKELKNPTAAAVPRSDAAKQRRRTDRDRHQRHDPGRQGDHDLEQLGRSDRACGQGRPGQGHQGRDLGLADSLGRRRRRIRRSGRLRRNRQGDGRHDARPHRARRRQVRHPVGFARRGQPERLDRRDEDGAEGSQIRQAQSGRHGLRQRRVGEELYAGAGSRRQISRTSK